MDVLGLGIQLCKRAKQLFLGLLDSYSGAAAAYSLRKLSRGYSGPIIRVRRDGDADGATNERDFNSTNQIEDWVNGKLETTLPADVATSSAAYSLRKVKAGYTGDAVRIRRASDDVEVDVAFDTNGAVSASSAITNVEDISLISESGFATDTGGFESSISGANFSFGNTLDGKSNVLFASFDGSGLLGLNFATSDVAIGDVVVYSFDVYWESTNIGELPDLRIRSGNTTIGHTDVPMPSKDSWYTFSGQFTVTSNTPAALTLTAANSSGLTTGDIFAIANGSYAKQQDAGNTTATTLGEFLTEGVVIRTSDFSSSADSFITLSSDTITFNEDGIGGLDDNLSSTAGDAGSQTLGLNGATVAGKEYKISVRYFIPESNGGSYSEVTIRDGASIKIATDSSPSTGSWITLEGTATYTSSQIRIQFTGTSVAGDKVYIREFSITETKQDATVVTWYDQSGNGYDLTQDTAGNQPKIAEDGSLLTLGGKPTIKPDGSDNFLINENAAWNTINSTNLSCMTVTEGSSLTNKILWGIGSSGDEDTDWLVGGGSVVGDLKFRGNRINSEAASVGTSGALLLTALDVTGGDGFVNGTAIGSPDTASRNVTADRLVLFTRRGTSSLGTCTDQSISEIIFYSSDQSDNRFKIESNINNYYGLSNVDLAGDFTASGAESFTADGTNGFTLTNSTSTAFAGIELEQALAAGDKIYVSFNLRIDAGANTSPNLIVREGSITGTSATDEPFFIPSEGNNSTSFTSDSGGDAQYITFGENDIDPSTYTISNFRVSKFPFNDGFVHTWYDQSGNGYDATQDTLEDEQPTIVSAGSLLADGIDFDGVDDKLNFTALSASDLSIFSVVTFDSVAGQERIIGPQSGANEGFGIGNATTGFFRASGTANSPALNATISADTTTLYSLIRASNTGTFFTDSTASTAFSNSDTFAGASLGGASNPVDGSLKEIIIYTSDQSANRSGIESNIADHYGITLP